MTRLVKRITVAGAVLTPIWVQAHPGHHGHGGFVGGLVHPLGGLDHLLAMVAVGFFAAQRGGRSVWAIPMIFVIAMLSAAAVGMSGLAVPFAEQAIAASVLVFGLLIVAAGRLPASFATGIIGLFGLFHGYAHGVGMSADVSGLSYSFGFLATTMVLLGCGGLLGAALKKDLAPVFSRCVGGMIALGGLALSFAA